MVSETTATPLFTGIGIQVKDNVTEPVGLIDDSGKAITVLLDDGSAAILDRSLIANIYYHPQTASPAP